MLLVDTSVWIEIFRKGSARSAWETFDFDEAVTCLPVIQEVLQGFADEAAYRQAHESMFSLPVVESPLGRGVFEEAAQLYRLGRRQGLRIRSSVDCLIAACAIRNDLIVLHKDRDFGALARVSSLRQRSLSL